MSFPGFTDPEESLPLILPPLGGMEDAIAEGAKTAEKIAAAAMGEQARVDVEIVDQFSSKEWRLANLYFIVDEHGTRVKFVPNFVQVDFMLAMWYRNCILKARQEGFTTLIDLWILDECLFYPNQTGGIIADTLDNAKKIFRNKIDFPYRNLPAALQSALPAENDTAQELVFKHANEDGAGYSTSTIFVGTTARSSTLQYLHISEYGKICANYPDKAREIKTGAFPAVHAGNYVFVESTAAGREGDFFDMCRESRARTESGRPLSQLETKFHFYPWYQAKGNRIPEEDAVNIPIPKSLVDYFTQLETKHGIMLDLGQMAWYTIQKSILGEDIKKEHPSTADEPFEVSIEGAYFFNQMLAARRSGRIGSFPLLGAVAVDTWWDLGVRDKQAIWFSQTYGGTVRFVHYYENTDNGLQHYVDYIHTWRDENEAIMGKSVGPHDLRVRAWETGVERFKTAKRLGIDFIVAPQFDIDDQIEAARNAFQICEFDERNCDVGLIALDNFRKEWNETMGVYADKPRHDWASHASSAYMLFACMHAKVQTGNARARTVLPAPHPYT